MSLKLADLDQCKESMETIKNVAMGKEPISTLSTVDMMDILDTSFAGMEAQAAVNSSQSKLEAVFKQDTAEYVKSLSRDFTYITRGRRFMKALGIHNTFAAARNRSIGMVQAKSNEKKK